MPTLICEKEKVQILKIGITSDPEMRLKYHQEKIPDFRYLKVWKVKYAKTLESWILEENYKSGFCSFGCEWFWDTDDKCEEFLRYIDWLVENTYTRTRSGYSFLYK